MKTDKILLEYPSLWFGFKGQRYSNHRLLRDTTYDSNPQNLTEKTNFGTTAVLTTLVSLQA